jgi:hypothetical protein
MKLTKKYLTQLIKEELENVMSEEAEEGVTAREALLKAWQDLLSKKKQRDEARSEYATKPQDVVVLHNYLGAEEMVTAAENTFKKLKAELEKMQSGK